jgi:hypothetical protein
VVPESPPQLFTELLERWLLLLIFYIAQFAIRNVEESLRLGSCETAVFSLLHQFRCVTARSRPEQAGRHHPIVLNLDHSSIRLPPSKPPQTAQSAEHTIQHFHRARNSHFSHLNQRPATALDGAIQLGQLAGYLS